MLYVRPAYWSSVSIVRISPCAYQTGIDYFVIHNYECQSEKMIFSSVMHGFGGNGRRFVVTDLIDDAMLITVS